MRDLAGRRPKITASGERLSKRNARYLLGVAAKLGGDWGYRMNLHLFTDHNLITSIFAVMDRAKAQRKYQVNSSDFLGIIQFWIQIALELKYILLFVAEEAFRRKKPETEANLEKVPSFKLIEVILKQPELS